MPKTTLKTLLWTVAVLALAAGLAACREESTPVTPAPGPAGAAPTLLALGDSYTRGHGVPTDSSWPRQLAAALAAGGDTLTSVEIVAESGWTTDDLLAGLNVRFPDGGATPAFGLVTLLIGANNLFREQPLEDTAADWLTLLTRAVALAGDRADRVLVLSLPDYGVTPMGGLTDPAAVRRGIDAHNTRLGEICAGRGVTLLNITPLSRQAASDPSLVARDGLHYTAEMYRRWSDLVLPAARTRLHAEAEGAPR